MSSVKGSGPQSKRSIKPREKNLAAQSLAEQVSQGENAAVVGITARVPEGIKTADKFAEVLKSKLGGDWEVEGPSPTGYLDAQPLDPKQKLDPSKAWEVCRSIENLGFADAEPIYLVVSPSEEAPGASKHFGIWGELYSPSELAEMEKASQPGDWAIQQMQVDKAWKRFPATRVPGDGVLVGHPDTGYTDHHILSGKLRLQGSMGFFGPTADARDLMADGLGRNPGHGTATGSLIVGDTAKSNVFGVAPGAKILPLRVSDSVIHFNFGNVSRAIEHAVREGVDVISMSLGGPLSSGRLEAAVDFALRNGVIVVSAAGNMLPTVMFPAAIPGIIAMAASNPIMGAWRFSGYGEEVTATAPGELVWNARSVIERGKQQYLVGRGAGTSFATAHVAGIAALWLSFHGKSRIVHQLDGDASLLPYAFHMLLTKTADGQAPFVKTGGFGAGLVDANALLGVPLNKLNAHDVRAHREKIRKTKQKSLADISLAELGMFFRIPIGRGLAASVRKTHRTLTDTEIEEALTDLFGGIPLPLVAHLLRELTSAIVTKDALRLRFVHAGNREGDARKTAIRALRRELLREPLSAELAQKLGAAAKAARSTQGGTRKVDVECCNGHVNHAEDGCSGNVPKPNFRRLRVYTFDPSLSVQMETRKIQQAIIEVPWEDLEPGPVGEYLEVIDVDPANDCAYCPVDLDDPHLIAQDGHEPSMGNPQFHQQMVYAVAMKTVKSFESALGRPLFWSPLRPRIGDEDDKRPPVYWETGRRNVRDQYIPRLRIYPHALRDQNAYYSPEKRALLFGYFNATEDSPGEVYPGGIVFTCLSHDIVAHETTHAIIDGMHTEFNNPTNPDVYAFHEAISDIVALFQHFTYPEVLRDQIAKTRGDLNSGNLLLQLAQEFGRATGGHHSLRDAIGGMVAVTSADLKKGSDGTLKKEVEVVKMGPAGPYKTTETKRVYQRYQPDATLLDDLDYAGEAHARGSILVAAVFDAFLAIYSSRTADLRRIATNGSGVLPEGHLQADLVNRLAEEARKSAEHVLRMCVRGLDYTPPFDITFGEYLRAIITADRDLVPADPKGYRVAFIESFRKWGIYPRDVRVLAEESLVWHPVTCVRLFDDDAPPPETPDRGRADVPPRVLFENVRNELSKWQPGADREDVFKALLEGQSFLFNHLKSVLHGEGAAGNYHHELRRLLKDIFQYKVADKRFKSGFREEVPKKLGVAKLRPARRIGPNNEFKTEMVFEVMARREVDLERKQDQPEQPDNGDEAKSKSGDKKTEEPEDFLGGATFIVDMDTWCIRYIIWKSLGSQGREGRFKEYRRKLNRSLFGAAEYNCSHYDGDEKADRHNNIDAMRADSCDCRTELAEKKKKNKERKNEPFAALHRGTRDQVELTATEETSQ